MQLVEITDAAAWDQFVERQSWGHPLQLWGWGEAKRSNGWTPYRLVLMAGEEWTAGVQVLLWPIPRTGRFVAYVPRGPIVDPTNPAAARLLVELVAWARQHKALYVRLEPAWVKGKLPRGWVASRHTIQMNETYTIDLNKSEAELMEPMARKHRQYIRKAERDGVSVQRLTAEVAAGGGLESFYQIYSETAQRAGFGIHGAKYYADLYGALGEDHTYLYYALYEGRPVAFLWLAAAGEVAYELYGGVTETGQAMKANYFLKWTAMMEQKAAGRRVYDFNGRLNEGVSQFKQGFGPDETDYIGTWDYPLNNLGYQMWERLWPVAKVVGRKLARVRRR